MGHVSLSVDVDVLGWERDERERTGCRSGNEVLVKVTYEISVLAAFRIFL
jgi:hypothetical protein